MQKRSTVSTALWFIPLAAVVLALLLTLVGFIGWKLLGRVTSSSAPTPPARTVRTAKPKPVAPTAPIVPFVAVDDQPQEIPVPQEVLDMPASAQEASAQTSAPEVCPSSYVPAKIKKPTRKVVHTPFQRGLMQCKRNNSFPCAWEDKTAGVIKQYWLMSADGPLTRGVYDMGGNLQSETVATANGTVTSHTEQNTTWYFQAGMLVKIRTTPYQNCNFHDWFFINDTGKQDVCQCAYTAQDCCARSPYQEGMGHSYCELFPLDQEFCNP